MPGHADALRQRLEHLIQQHSQAEVARRAGWSPVNVHNYTKGTRIPAEFCCALAESLQVNPTWLLLGEGAPYLTQSTAETSTATLNLLELVQSMNAAMRMRLGALVGKDYAKALRELNEQLKGYLSLKDKLSDFFLPHYRRLLDDIDAALTKRSAHAAERFIEAAMSVASLCHDDVLAIRLLTSRALLAWLRGDVEEMLRLQGEAYLRSFATPATGEGMRAYQATIYIASLGLAGYWDKAKGVARATLNLMPNTDARTLATLNSMLARSCFELGQVRRAMRYVEKTNEAREIWYDDGLFSARMLCLWGSGLVALDSMIEGCVKDPQTTDRHRQTLLSLAVCAEDENVLERACRALVPRIDPSKVPGAAFAHMHAPLLLGAMKGGKGKRVAEFDEQMNEALSRAGRQRWGPVYVSVLRGQLARHLDDSAEVKKSVTETIRLLKELPGEAKPMLTIAAIHCRNASAAANLSRGTAREKFARIADTQRERLAHAAGNGCVVLSEFAQP